jgi:hypothetical protein
MKSYQKRPFLSKIGASRFASMLTVIACFVVGMSIYSASDPLAAPDSNLSPKYKVDTNPNYVVLGDLNGDGIPDLAVANSGSTTISILLGRGDGTFQTAVNYSVGPHPESIAMGDFNGDGKVDLAVALHGTSAVAVLLGNGDGTFQSAVTYSVQANATSVVTADFDADGKLDLAVANDSSGSVSILIGNGDGTFQSAVNYTVGTYPTFLVVADFNSDGKPDLAVANGGSSSVSILVGKGDGTFNSAINYSTGTGPGSIAIGDFDGDGKLDLAVANTVSGNVSILLANGDATFKAEVRYTVETDPTSVATKDLNGDGHLDLVVTNRFSDTVSVLLGKGDGTFNASINYVVGNGPSSISVADLNGDNAYDLVITCYDSSALVVLLGQPGGSFPAVLNYDAGAGPNQIPGVAVADFDGDGKLDLVGFSGASSSTNLSIHLSNGDGTFQPALITDVGVVPNFVAAGDLDGNGQADLAVANISSTNVSVLLGNGDGTFASAVTYSAGATPNAITLGDFNGDGIKDLCVVTSSGLSVLLGSGDGTFQTAITTSAPFPGNQATSVVVADVNGDGISDVVVADPANYALVVFLGNGDGSFRLASKISTKAIPTSIAVGDLNRDGKFDLVVGNQSFSGTFSVYWGNGDGTFQAPTVYQPGIFPGTISSVAVADFNGDGILDIAATNNFSNELFILLGKGNGTFQSPIAYDSGGLPSSIVASDLNGDGRSDLAVGMSGGISIFLSSSFPANTSSSLLVPTGGAVSSVTISTERNVQTGYARVFVNSGTTPYGTAVFALNQNGVTVSETAVPASPPTTTARILIEYRTVATAKSDENASGSLSVNTGIALVNDGNDTAHLTCQLFDASGTPLASGHGNLALNGHYSAFITELSQLMPDFVMPASFLSAIQFGSLQIQSDQSLSILALRLTINQRGETLVSSTPVADLSKLLSSDPLLLPRLADGGGWKTAFYLMNTSSGGTETGTVQLFGQNGTPLTVHLNGGSSGSSFAYSIPPNGVRVFQTDGSPIPINTGWIKIVPDSGIAAPSGIGIFGLSQGGILVTESGIPSVLPTTHARIYVDKSGGHDTGLAISNPGSAALNVTLQAFQTDGVTPAGNSLGPLTISGNGETAAYVGQLISGLPNEFTGVLDISSSSPFVPLTMRSLTNTRSESLVTMFPVADFNQPAPSPIVFPQITNGVGYQTKFIFLSAGGAAITTVSYFNNAGSPVAWGQ